MNATPEYGWLAVALSLIALGLSVVYGWRVTRVYRMYHDERAAVGLAKGVGLVVIALGLTVSATGLVIEASLYAIAGMSIARGALVVLMATLILADVRPRER